MQLTFNVNKQTLSRSDDEFPASGSKEYLTAKFTFSEDWNGTTKTAVFSRNSLVFNQILDDNGECNVPHDIIVSNGAVVSVFGTNGTKRITTIPLFVRIDLSGYIEGETPPQPTPTVYEQIIGKLDEIETDMPNVPDWALAPDKPTYKAAEVGALPDTTIIPDVPAWAMQPEKPEYTASEVNALPDTTEIPDVPAWALETNKPTYTASEVGALPDTADTNFVHKSGDETISGNKTFTENVIAPNLVGGNTAYGGTIVDNLNNITKNGFYTCYGTAIGAPNTSFSWFVIHQNSNAGTTSATQRCTAYGDNSIVYERKKVDGVWKDFVLQVSRSEFDGAITDLDSQLAAKVNQGGLDIQRDLDKNKSKIDQTMITDELLQQIAGTTPINSVPANNSLTIERFSKNIPPLFLEGFVLEQNLYNKDTVTTGGYNFDGTFNSGDSTRKTSDYISVLGSTMYYRLLTSTTTVAFFDSNQAFISRPNAEQVITTPSNAAYMRLVLLNADVPNEVVALQQPTKYVPCGTYKYTISNQLKLSDGTRPTFLDGVTFKQNILDSSKFVVGGLSSNGTLNTGVINNYCSDYVPISPNTNYYRLNTSVALIAYYDSDKVFISRPTINSGITSFRSPANAHYLRYTDVKANMLAEVFATVQPTSYTPYNVGQYVMDEKYVFITSYTSKFKGKTWVVFGDSITQGVGSSNESTMSYPSQIARMYGINIINKGITGASWQKDGVYDDICVLTQIANTDFTDVDYVTIFAGTNDWGRDTLPIGTPTDTFENTLYGAINLSIERIIAANPNIKIAIISPMWRQRQSAGDNKDSDTMPLNGKYLIDYVNVILDAAKKNHIPSLNLYDTCMFNKYNYTYFLADGLHPNDAGYGLLADKIHSYLSSIY